MPHSEQGAEVISDFDPYRRFVQRVPELIDQARDTYYDEREAYSYRGFRVGLSGLVMTRGSHDTGTLTAGNLKKVAKPKLCAEQRFLARVRKAGYDQVVGFVLAATTDRTKITEVTGLATPTLHPCDECRAKLSRSSLITDDTLVVSAGIDKDYYQVQRWGQLTDRYGSEEEDALIYGDIGFGFEEWDKRVTYYDEFVRGNPAIEARARLAQAALTISLD